jgi:hypothetical protein
MHLFRAAIRFALLAPAFVFAQFSSSIEGTVVDSSGAVVPNAKVTITNNETGVTRSITTSGEGFYRIVNLALGQYTVSVEVGGFRPAEQHGVRLAASETARVNFTLEVGTVGEKVTVEAQTPQVETEQGRVSGVIETQKLKEMPLNGRNMYNLLAVQPGVSGRGVAATFGAGGGGSNNDGFAAENQPEVYASGQRVESNSYTVDDSSVNSAARGGVANLTPNPDSIAEVRVVSNNFSAVNGRSSGGQVELVTKSGTNTFHGGATEFFENNALSSRNEFEAKTSVYRRNEFGYYFGGPVARNRTFFFTSFEGLRQSGARGQIYTVETARFRDYVIANYPNSIAAKALVAGRPAVDPDSGFRSIANPAPGQPGISLPAGFPALGNVSFAPAAYRNGQQFNGRIDHQLRPGKDTLYGAFYRTWADTLNGGIRPAFDRPGHEFGTFISLNETHIFNPAMLNEFRGNMIRVVGLSDFPPNAQIPSISITSVSGFSTNGYPSGYFQTSFNYKDVFSWIHGSHTWKFGGELRRVRSNSINTSNYIPSYSFTSLLTFAADSPFQETRLVDPQTGLPAMNRVGLRNYEWALFVNDDWKVSRKLTLNLGVRYENFESPTEINGLLRNIVFGGGSTFSERLANATMQTVEHLYPPSPGTIVPRFGFAFDPDGRGKTSIRGGYGIAYDRLFMTPILDFRNDPPLRATATVGPQFGTSFTYALGDPSKPYLGFPVDPSLQLGINEANGIKNVRVAVLATDPNFKQAYTHNWFLGVQHDIGWRVVMEADYTGSAGHHLYENSNVNRFRGDLLANGAFHGFNPYFSAVNFISSGSNSFYNGFNLHVRRAFRNGFSIQGVYTFSKVIDDADTLTNAQNYLDVGNRGLDRAPAGFDVTHRLSLNGLWELPALATRNRAARTILGGWQLSGFAIFQTGYPFTVFNGANPAGDYNLDGTAGDRPNAPLTPLVTSGYTRAQFLSGIFPTSAFPIPVPGSNGSLGRNTFRGPGFAEVDLSLGKRFPITERIHLSIRLDSYNALNHVNLNPPVSDLSSSNFGRSTSALLPRQYQGGARIEF